MVIRHARGGYKKLHFRKICLLPTSRQDLKITPRPWVFLVSTLAGNARKGRMCPAYRACFLPHDVRRVVEVIYAVKYVFIAHVLTN